VEDQQFGHSTNERDGDGVPRGSEAASARRDANEAPPAISGADLALEAEREAGRAVLERLRSMMAASDPALSADLLPGETLEQLEASFAAATAALARARATAAGPPPVGAGAPGRSEAAPGTAFAKIRAGLSERAWDRVPPGGR
jgi:hypothetical protein